MAGDTDVLKVSISEVSVAGKSSVWQNCHNADVISCRYCFSNRIYTLIVFFLYSKLAPYSVLLAAELNKHKYKITVLLGENGIYREMSFLKRLGLLQVSVCFLVVSMKYDLLVFSFQWVGIWPQEFSGKWTWLYL